MLEVNFLGHFETRLDGQAVEIPSRPAQSLLAYLVLKPGTPHRREKLAGLFWPDAAETNARSYLRQALWRLRKALPAAADGYFQTDDLTVAFNAQADYRLDAAELEKDLGAAATTQALIECVSVYQGELLPGFYDEWIALERERLQAVYEARMKEVLERLAAEQRWPDLAAWAERWIALGHTPEPAYRGLMLAHHGLGDRASMGTAYQRCEEALRRDLGVAPSEATRALYARLSAAPVAAVAAAATPEPAPAPRRVELKRRPVGGGPGGLPRQLTSFVGREREMAEVQALLAERGSRLITLTGVGGCGKTRLSLQVGQAVAARYPQGVWFVELASLADPALVPQRVVATLGVLQEPGRSAVDTLGDYLCAKTSLLILDNCEHVISGCAALAEALLRACPQLHILASSRETLGIPGEIVFRVPSLSVPNLVAAPAAAPSAEELSAFEAVRLFLDRAAAALPGFTLTSANAAALTQVCRRLDGIPLAIELAAARVGMLTVDQIAARLGDRFRLLTGGSRTAMPRQQTLRATMDWSYNLLTPPERELFAQLSVFANGWTLEAAEAVCGPAPAAAAAFDVLETLTQLVNKSLAMVDASFDGAARYRLLETIHNYAQEKLAEAASAAEVHQRHLAYFLALTQRAEPALTGPDQVTWLNRLDEELDNVRAALEWALESNPPAGLELAGAMGRFWDFRDHRREGSAWLRQLLAAPGDAPPLAQARAWNTLGLLCIPPHLLADAQAAAEAGLALSRAHGDRREAAFSQMILGQVATHQGDFGHADTLLNQSLATFQELDDKASQAHLLMWWSVTHRDTQQARVRLEQSLAINRELGHLAGIATNLGRLAQQAIWEGHYGEARPWLAEAIQLMHQVGSHMGEARLLYMYSTLALRQGDLDRAQAYGQESLALFEAAGQTNPWAQAVLALIAGRRGDLGQARALYAECLGHFRTTQVRSGVIFCVEGLLSLAAPRQPAGAVQLLGWADAARDAAGDPRPPGEQKDLEHDLAAAQAQPTSSPALTAAYAAGRTLTADQAVADALDLLSALQPAAESVS